MTVQLLETDAISSDPIATAAEWAELRAQVAEMHAFIMGLQEMLNSPMIQSAMGGMFG
jgi:hypothetical protein